MCFICGNYGHREVRYKSKVKIGQSTETKTNGSVGEGIEYMSRAKRPSATSFTFKPWMVVQRSVRRSARQSWGKTDIPSNMAAVNSLHVAHFEKMHAVEGTPNQIRKKSPEVFREANSAASGSCFTELGDQDEQLEEWDDLAEGEMEGINYGNDSNIGLLEGNLSKDINRGGQLGVRGFDFVYPIII